MIELTERAAAGRFEQLGDIRQDGLVGGVV
jgi:hypothetical protein